MLGQKSSSYAYDAGQQPWGLISFLPFDPLCKKNKVKKREREEKGREKIERDRDKKEITGKITRASLRALIIKDKNQQK